MTGSLAFRKNEAAIMRGEVPAKYTRLLPFITGARVLEIGSAEGVLASLLVRADVGRKASVTAIERSTERHEAALRLQQAWRKLFPFGGIARFCNGDIADRLELLEHVDTLVAVRMIYYLRDQLDPVFAAIGAKVPEVVLCGNRSRAAWHTQGIPDKEAGPVNFYASADGMRQVLERHGYTIATEVRDGDPIVVGRKAL